MIKLGRSFWWMVILIIVSFVVSRLPDLSQNPIYIRLIVALLVILMANAVWSWASIVGVRLRRSTRTIRKQVGEIFTERFEVVNSSIIPKIWLKVSDQMQINRSSGSRVITWLAGRQSRAYIAYTLLQQRGWFQLGPTEIETGDIFGLFLIRKEVKSNTRLLVIPYTVNISAFPAPFGLLAGGRALRQKTLEVTPYAAGVREYVAGDPLKCIHWLTSARKEKLIVKEFERDPLAEVWIFIDARASVHFRKVEEEPDHADDLLWVKEKRDFTLPPDTEEYAVCIAATISKYYIRQKREVGLVSAGQSYTVLPAERGERQLGKILETLAVLRAEGDMPFSGLIGSQLGHFARGSTVILISPSSDEKILTVVMELVQRGLVPVVILIDQMSFGGEEDAESLQSKLINQGIFTFLIHEGDDIKTLLENPNLAFSSRFMHPARF